MIRFQYKSGMPYVSGHISWSNISSAKVPFLVDTGASRSIFPRAFVPDTITVGPYLPTELQDASGSRISGAEMSVCVRIDGLLGRDGLPSSIPERILIVQNAQHSLLGQTWLERVVAKFENLPPNRRFWLHLI